MLENLVALSLIRRYGSKETVYHYNHGIEVDFYIPETETAIQASYTISSSNETFERETKALIKIGERLSVKRRIIVTYEEESTIDKEGFSIEVIPAWKFLLTYR